MDELERQLRDVLTSDRRALPSQLVALDAVHVGASRRLRRRRAVAASASAAVVGVVAFVMVLGVAPGANQALDPADRSQSEQSKTMNDEDERTPPSPKGLEAAPWDDAKVTSVTATSTRTMVVLGKMGAGSDACSTDDCLRLAESHDGGRTFTPLPVPESATAEDVDGVRFGSGDDGWLFGKALWSSHDGGESWSRVEMPGEVVRLEAAAGFVWALVDPGGDGKTEQLWNLWKSPVATDDWEPAGAVINGPGDLAVQGTRVVAVGPANGVRSDDGSDFEQVDFSCGDAADIKLSASGGLWATCVPGPEGEKRHESPTIFTSADGKSWTEAVFDRGGGDGIDTLTAGARTENEGIIWVGRNGRFFQLVPGEGVTDVEDPPTGEASYIGFTTASIGYAISEGVLWRTEDGGKKWQRLQIR